MLRLFIFDLKPNMQAHFYTDKAWIWPDIVKEFPGLAHVPISSVQEKQVDLRESDVKIDTVFIPININQEPKAY